MKIRFTKMQGAGNDFVVLDETGKVLHIQDSSFLEEGKGYNEEKVLRFLKSWTPQAIKG